MSDGKLVLYGTDGQKVGEATTNNGEVIFPSPDFRWTWVLDARHAPYDGLERKALLERAEHVRKRFVLVRESDS